MQAYRSGCARDHQDLSGTAADPQQPEDGGSYVQSIQEPAVCRDFEKPHGGVQTKSSISLKQAMKMTNNIFQAQAIAHLQPEVWEKVTRLHISKIIADLSHEGILQPALQSSQNGWGHYSLHVEKLQTEYRFKAKVMSLQHWVVDPASIEKIVAGDTAKLEAVSCIIELNEQIGIAPEALPG